MRQVLLAVTLAAALGGAAEALTIRDVIELSRAGLSDDVILALIEVDGGVYPTDAATLKQLKTSGVSDRVMIALVRSGRERVEPPPVPQALPVSEPPEPQVVVIDHHDPVERVREVPVAVPVYIPVQTGSRRRLHDAGRVQGGPFDASNFVPFQSGPPAARPVAPKSEPVYWGWGGKRRPDTWDPAPGEVKPPDRRK